MDMVKVRRKWGRIKKHLKQRFSTLSDEDLEFEPGKFEQMLGKIVRKTNISMDKIKQEIEVY